MLDLWIYLYLNYQEIKMDIELPIMFLMWVSGFLVGLGFGGLIF